MEGMRLHLSLRAATSVGRASLVLRMHLGLHAGASAKFVGMVPATRPVSSTSTTLAAPDPVPDAGAPAKRAALAPGSFMKYMSEQSHSSGERLSDVEAMAQARPTRRRSAGAGCKCGCSMLACARAAAALLK